MWRSNSRDLRPPIGAFISRTGLEQQNPQLRRRPLQPRKRTPMRRPELRDRLLCRACESSQSRRRLWSTWPIRAKRLNPDRPRALRRHRNLCRHSRRLEPRKRHSLQPARWRVRRPRVSTGRTRSGAKDEDRHRKLQGSSWNRRVNRRVRQPQQACPSVSQLRMWNRPIRARRACCSSKARLKAARRSRAAARAPASSSESDCWRESTRNTRSQRSRTRIGC